MYNVCDACGIVDEQPKHAFVVEPGTFPVNNDHVLAVLDRTDLTNEQKAEAILDIQDTEVQRRHFVCCVAAGCPAAGQGEADCAHRVGG